MICDNNTGGIDMVKATIDIALGIEPDIIPRFSKGSAIRFFKVPCGVIESIEGVESSRKAEGIKEIILNKKVGDMVSEIHSSLDRVGFVIAQGKDVSEAISRCEMNGITINVR